nr:hypothetical protein DM860_007366 [Ipomoea trifida]
MDSESRSACKLQQKDANSDVFKMLGKDLVFGLSLNSPVEIAQSCTAISDFIEDLKYIKFGDVVSRENLPIRMGYWLVQNYNPKNSTLYLADGTGVSITDEDVQLVFYFDPVVVFTRDIPRQIPSFVGWTSQLIKEREVAEIQARGFGLGRVEDRFRPAAENIQGEDDSATGLYLSLPVMISHQFNHRGLLEVFIANYMEKLDLLGKTFVEMIEMASKPPHAVRDNEVIKLMHSVTQKLLGGGRVTVDSSIQKGVEASSGHDSFWCNLENIAAIVTPQIFDS